MKTGGVWSLDKSAHVRSTPAREDIVRFSTQKPATCLKPTESTRSVPRSMRSLLRSPMRLSASCRNLIPCPRTESSGCDGWVPALLLLPLECSNLNVELLLEPQLQCSWRHVHVFRGLIWTRLTLICGGKLSGKLNRGLSVVASFKTLKPEHTEEELIKANILGWCVELVRFLLECWLQDESGVLKLLEFSLLVPVICSSKPSSWSRTISWTALKLAEDNLAGTKWCVSVVF